LSISCLLTWILFGCFTLVPLRVQGEVNLEEIDQLPEDEQVAAFQLLVEKEPHNARFHNSLGFCYHRRGDYELAEKYYAAALHLDPTYATAYNNLGALCLKRGQYQESRYYFEKALEHNPSHVKAMYNLGVVHFKQGNYFKALRCYYHAKTMDACYVKERGTSEKAKKELDEALKKNPESRILKQAHSQLNHSSLER